MAISMLKIRRPLGRLIFNMGIAIPGKTVFLIETAPWRVCEKQCGHSPVRRESYCALKSTQEQKINSQQPILPYLCAADFDNRTLLAIQNI